jgi:hypothetical protein
MAGPDEPDAMLITTASRIQASTSSRAPQASASEPNLVSAMPRSLIIRAIIGNAVMASATPTNAAEVLSDTPGTTMCAQRAPINVIITPSASGSRLPASEIAPTVRMDLRMRSVLNS